MCMCYPSPCCAIAIEDGVRIQEYICISTIFMLRNFCITSAMVHFAYKHSNAPGCNIPTLPPSLATLYRMTTYTQSQKSVGNRLSIFYNYNNYRGGVVYRRGYRQWSSPVPHEWGHRRSHGPRPPAAEALLLYLSAPSCAHALPLSANTQYQR